MPYISKPYKEQVKIGKHLDKLQKFVESAMAPWCKIAFDSGTEWGFVNSRYSHLEASDGSWIVKIRVADHVNQSSLYGGADIVLLVGEKWTKAELIDAIFRCIRKQIFGMAAKK